MYLSSEEKSLGKENFCAAVGSKLVRRDLLKKAINDDVAPGRGLGPLYFHYDASIADPVRVGLIGAGDGGGVLLGAVNPKFIAVKAIADIRPYNVWRAFNGDHYADAHNTRPGLMNVYGWKTDAEAKKNVKVYACYEELIAHAKQDGIEAVIIALPLHLHAPAAVAAMKAGLHVMTETPMAHSVRECKEMARVANQAKLLLATGHQRRYNILYDDAAELIRKGALGEVHHIRAQWHRPDLPGRDTWQPPMPNRAKPGDLQAGKLDKDLQDWLAALEKLKLDKPKAAADWEKKMARLGRQIEQLRAQIADDVDAKKFGYESKEIKDASGKVVYTRPAIEELIRWRLWDRTGRGLMGELGIQQFDAVSLLIAAAHDVEQWSHPLSAAAAGDRPLFPTDRDCEDHAYCVFEFPELYYDPKSEVGKQKKVGVQYAAINGNEFGGYGETVFGTEGTLVLEAEKDAMLFKTHMTEAKTKVVSAKTQDKKDTVALKVDDKGDPESAAIGALGTLPAGPGFTEELEHWAWCIRHRAPENVPHGHPKVALADAVVALVADLAVRNGQQPDPAARQGARIDFQKAWFDIDDDATPENQKPDIKRYV